jgi:hypothetical protein
LKTYDHCQIPQSFVIFNKRLVIKQRGWLSSFDGWLLV